jgi:hypothetical protein
MTRTLPYLLEPGCEMTQALQYIEVGVIMGHELIIHLETDCEMTHTLQI